MHGAVAAGAHTTGYVFQGAGTVLMLVGGFFWVLSGFVIDSVDEAPRRWTDYLAGDRLAPALAAIGIVASVVGGLAIATAGIGLHQDRPSSGRFALAVTALLSITYWTVGLLLLIVCGAWAAGTVAVIMALCSTVMFLLAGQSAGLQRRFPPPAHNVITSQELAELRESSRH